MTTKRRTAAAVFPWSLWYWTAENENLFMLDKETLYTYRLIVEAATKKEG